MIDTVSRSTVIIAFKPEQFQSTGGIHNALYEGPAVLHRLLSFKAPQPRPIRITRVIFVLYRLKKPRPETVNARRNRAKVSGNVDHTVSPEYRPISAVFGAVHPIVVIAISTIHNPVQRDVLVQLNCNVCTQQFGRDVNYWTRRRCHIVRRAARKLYTLSSSNDARLNKAQMCGVCTDRIHCTFYDF